MANPEHLAQLRKGSSWWNQWRSKHLPTSLGIHPDLQGARLCGLDLRGIDLSWGNLDDVVIENCRLDRGRFEFASLKRASLGGVFVQADFSKADMASAAFPEWTPMHAADFSGACLEGAHMDEVIA